MLVDRDFLSVEYEFATGTGTLNAKSGISCDLDDVIDYFNDLSNNTVRTIKLWQGDAVLTMARKPDGGWVK